MTKSSVLGHGADVSSEASEQGSREAMRHTFSVYVEDKPGVLNRIASLFRRRAFNIESLTVGQTDTPGVSRMTIVAEADSQGARRLEANLYKLVNVLRVHDITSEPAVFRELVMIKVETKTPEDRIHVLQLVDVFRARVVDVARDSVIIETTGTEDKIGGFLEVLRPHGILELVRTGRVGMVRGPRSVMVEPPAPPRPERQTPADDENISYSV